MGRKECGAAPLRLYAAGRRDLVLLSHTHTHTAQLLDAHAASYGYLHFHLALDTCAKRRRGEGGGGGGREGKPRGGRGMHSPADTIYRQIQQR